MRLALDGLKGASETLNRAKIEEAVANVRTALINAQETALTLQAEATEHGEEKAALERRVTELTKEIESVNKWEVRAKCYTLKPTMPNSETFVMEFDPKKGEECGIIEPAHRACPVCFQQYKFSILVQERPSIGAIHCQPCGFKMAIRESASIEVIPIERGRRNWSIGL